MINQGLPDGYQFNRNIEGRNEGTLKQEKQQQTLNELYKTLPSNLIRGNPLHYGDDGLPIIENDPLAEQYEMSVERQIQQQMQQQQQTYQPVPQKQTDPNAFFTAPSKRSQMQQQRPPQQNPQVPVQSQVPVQPQQSFQPLQEESLQYHPVIKKMLNVFGLKKNSRHTLDVFNENTNDKVTYTMTLVSEELQSWVMVESKARMAIEPDVGPIYFELLFGCSSIIAIDHIPVYTAFNIPLLEDEQLELANDPLEIPIRIRKKSASLLAIMFWKDLVPFADKILEFYQEKVLGRKIQSSLDREASNRIRYVCPLDECENYEFFPPIENGIEKQYYCKYHGVDLVKTVDLKKESDIPLA